MPSLSFPLDFVSPAPLSPIRRSFRPRQTPSYLKDYICNNIRVYHSPHYLHRVIGYDRLSPAHRNFVLNVHLITEPKSYHQAAQIPEWQEPMKTEISTLEENHTWDIVDFPPGKVPIHCKWVYKEKYYSDGTIEHYKARLVAKGYTQLEGINYVETFSLVAKMTIVWTLLAIATAQNWHLQ